MVLSYVYDAARMGPEEPGLSTSSSVRFAARKL
jgi:hypothetical protein